MSRTWAVKLERNDLERKSKTSALSYVNESSTLCRSSLAEQAVQDRVKPHFTQQDHLAEDARSGWAVRERSNSHVPSVGKKRSWAAHRHEVNHVHPRRPWLLAADADNTKTTKSQENTTWRSWRSARDTRGTTTLSALQTANCMRRPRTAMVNSSPVRRNPRENWEVVMRKFPWTSDVVLAHQESKGKNKQEVIDEARKDGNTIHFATLTDSFHLKQLRVGQAVLQDVCVASSTAAAGRGDATQATFDRKICHYRRAIPDFRLQFLISH